MLWVVREPACNRGGIVAVLQGRKNQDAAALGIEWWMENVIKVIGPPPIFERNTGVIDDHGNMVMEKIPNPCDIVYQKKIREKIDSFASRFGLQHGCSINQLLVEMLIKNHGFIAIHHDDVDFGEKLGIGLL